MRGGVSTVFYCQANVNNKYHLNYDETKETSYISYLDANDLYGWDMSKPLPTGNSESMNRRNIHEVFNEVSSNKYTPEKEGAKGISSRHSLLIFSP